MFCSSCGQQLEPGARFCGSCGTPVEADAAAPPPADPTPEAPQAEPTSQAPPPSPSGESRLPVRIVPAILGVIALVVVFVLLIQGLGGASGGADSPEAAVRQLAEAIENRDGAAAIAVLDPDEVGGLDDVYASLDVNTAGSGGSGEGSDSEISIEGLELSEERLGSDAAKVTFAGGTVSGALAFPGFSGSGSDVDLDFATEGGPQGSGHFAMTREVDGRWYVSPVMTGMEYLVEQEGLAPGEFEGLEGGPDQAPGSPRRLASELAEAINFRSASQLLALISNGEAGAVLPYSAALQNLANEVEDSVQLQVTDASFDEEDIGSGLVRLELEHMGLGLSSPDSYSSEEASISLDGFCASVVSSDGSTSNNCDTQVRRLFGVDGFFVVAKREDGGLRLAPIATLVEYARLLAEELGPVGVRRATGRVTAGADGELQAGSRVSGDLNEAGYATLTYRSEGGGLLALDGRPYLAMLDPDGSLLEPLACPNGSQLYELPGSGTYYVVAAAGDYRPGTYSVIADRVQPQTASINGSVSGTIGDDGRLAVFALDFPGEGELTFDSSSAVYSRFVEPGNTDEDCADDYDGSVEQVVGPESLFDPLPDFEAPEAPSPGSGYEYEYFYFGSSKPYLVISGAPGTKFSGDLSAEFE